MDMQCPDCTGTGTVMTRDSDISGCEEWGSCRRCKGSGKVDRDTAPETLMRKVNEMERRLTDRKMANGDMILGILDEADKNREMFEATAEDRGIRLNQLIAAAIAQAVSP